MPEICRFYGIVIKMFFKPKEHEPSQVPIHHRHLGFSIYPLQLHCNL